MNMPAIAFVDEIWQLTHKQIYVRKKFDPLHPERESTEQLVGILRSIGGYAFTYQYLQGLYRPRFGKEGEGSLFLTPYIEGEFYDARKATNKFMGFVKFKEAELILPRVFGIGQDPYPPNMRQRMTPEEWIASVNSWTLDQETGIRHYHNI